MMTFGEAVEAAKRGEHITRKGWNGKDQCELPARVICSLMIGGYIDD
jgi:hypothetical protein